jgi:geranylgeranyl reductase family protein
VPDSQAIVVGGGPAGSSTAFFLARLGIDTVILDRARFPRDKTCSEYLSPQATRILAEMNARQAIEAAGAAQLTGMRVHAPNGATIHGEFAATHGFRGYSDRGLAVRRTILDSILLDRARAAGAQVEEAVRVTDLIQDAYGRVTGLRTRDEHGTARERHADLIIGADGLRSVVARRLGLVKPARWPRRIALVTHYSGARDVGDLGEMHVERGGYCGIASVGSGLVNVAVVVPVSRAAEVAVDRTEFFESWIAERPALAAKLGAATRVGEVRATGPFATSARRAWHPGVALVGDAAEFFDPFTGEGIYTALRGGELLAEFAADAIRKPAAANESLKEYERMRRREFSGKWLIERIVGTAIAFPPLINRAAKVLSRRRDMADLLVGVVGDFVPAREVLRAGYLLNLIFDS